MPIVQVGAIVAFYCACSGGMLVINKLAGKRRHGMSCMGHAVWDTRVRHFPTSGVGPGSSADGVSTPPAAPSA